MFVLSGAPGGQYRMRQIVILFFVGNLGDRCASLNRGYGPQDGGLIRGRRQE